MLKLRVSGDNKDGIWLVEPKISVGRAASNNLVVDDPEVDDCHIEIFAKGEELIIHRRSDANTMVNGAKLGVKARLVARDKIQVGNTELEVVDPKTVRASRPPEREENDTIVVATPTLPGEGWQLRSSHTGLTRSTYDIRDGMIIGRAKDCEIVILLAHLSRRHAQFKVVGNNRLEITDLNSSNGTFVNGEQITTIILNDGDEIRFDTLTFSVIGPQEDLDKTMVRSVATDEWQTQMEAHRQQQEVHRRQQEAIDSAQIASSHTTHSVQTHETDILGAEDFDLDDNVFEPIYTTTAKPRRSESAPQESPGSVVAIGVISTVLLLATVIWLFF